MPTSTDNFVKPAPINWSRNYIYLGLNYSGLNPAWKLRVQFIDANSNEILGDTIYPLSGSSGGLIIQDIDEIMDPWLSWQYPTQLVSSGVGANAHLPEETIMQTRTFYVQHQPVYPGSSVGWTVESSKLYRVIKGGIGDLTFVSEVSTNAATYSRAKFMPNGQGFLTWIPQQRLITPKEWGWLLYLSDKASAVLSGNHQVVQYAVTYMDGTTATISNALPDSFAQSSGYLYRAWYIPIGIQQAQLDPAGKGVRFYIVSVTSLTPGDGLQASYRIDVDARSYYKTQTLYYRNSVGGIDHILLHGKTEYLGAEITKNEFSQRRAGAYVNNLNGADGYYTGEARYKFKGNTGFISMQHKATLSELFKTTWCAMLIGTQWFPMRVPPQKMDMISSKGPLPDRYSYSIEFETAGTFRSMPKQLQSLIPANY